MEDFRALAAEMDAEIFEALADDATVDGRPVRGMFTAPWLGPKLGRLNTGLTEPMLALLAADAEGVVKQAEVVVADGRYTVVAIQPDGSGLTNLVLRPAGAEGALHDRRQNRF